MAEDSDLKIEESGSGKKSKLMIIIAAVVVLLGAGVGGWLFLSGGEEPQVQAEAPQVQTSESAALYVGMPRPFVFNVAGDRRDRLVQIKVQLLVRGAANEELARLHIPLIEGSLLRVFSGATVDQLSSQEGKDKIRENALSETQQALTAITGKRVVERVLFTGFVMQ
jgi:flagellar FliL protein